MENISVYIRVKPKTKDEELKENLWKYEGNNILGLKNNKEIFKFGKNNIFKI
jgi:hypothetical protein